LKDKGFKEIADLGAVRMEPEETGKLSEEIRQFDDESRDLSLQLKKCNEWLRGRWLGETEWQVMEQSCKLAADRLEQIVRRDDLNTHRLHEMLARHLLRKEKETAYGSAAARRDRISQIESLIRGNAFVEFVAEDRLRAIVIEASEYLENMTRYRYTLELDSEMSFVVRDQMNGSQVRQARSLSGGETFMASLALALALSSQIQLRGQSRLEFFFLDEGFGSLDPVMLDIVMDSLERISNPKRMIGLISHVPELRQRLGTRLSVTPADSRNGSRINLERC
jgi:exonuclease SbcC